LHVVWLVIEIVYVGWLTLLFPQSIVLRSAPEPHVMEAFTSVVWHEPMPFVNSPLGLMLKLSLLQRNVAYLAFPDAWQGVEFLTVIVSARAKEAKAKSPRKNTRARDMEAKEMRCEEDRRCKVSRAKVKQL
jgi:hypothetical protein